MKTETENLEGDTQATNDLAEVKKRFTVSDAASSPALNPSFITLYAGSSGNFIPHLAQLQRSNCPSMPLPGWLLHAKQDHESSMQEEKEADVAE